MCSLEEGSHLPPIFFFIIVNDQVLAKSMQTAASLLLLDPLSPHTHKENEEDEQRLAR